MPRRAPRTDALAEHTRDHAYPGHGTTVSPSPVPTTTYYYPTGAPATGGGGTAGLQDGLVFVLGGAAIAAGLGSLVYRRKFTRLR